MNILDPDKINIKKLVVFDDCLSCDMKFLNDPNILEILTNGRHYNISIIVRTPFPFKFNGSFVGNLDYIFIGIEILLIMKKLYINNTVVFFLHIVNLKNHMMRL